MLLWGFLGGHDSSRRPKRVLQVDASVYAIDRGVQQEGPTWKENDVAYSNRDDPLRLREKMLRSFVRATRQ